MVWGLPEGLGGAGGQGQIGTTVIAWSIKYNFKNTILLRYCVLLLFLNTVLDSPYRLERLLLDSALWGANYKKVLIEAAASNYMGRN